MRKSYVLLIAITAIALISAGCSGVRRVRHDGEKPRTTANPPLTGKVKVVNNSSYTVDVQNDDEVKPRPLAARSSRQEKIWGPNNEFGIVMSVHAGNKHLGSVNATFCGPSRKIESNAIVLTNDHFRGGKVTIIDYCYDGEPYTYIEDSARSRRDRGPRQSRYARRARPTGIVGFITDMLGVDPNDIRGNRRNRRIRRW